MKTLYFEYPGMVTFTPPGGAPTQGSSITILAASSYSFGANGVTITTTEGDAVAPYGFITFRETPFVRDRW